MNIQIFGKAKCFDTKKAERYFKERRIPFQSIDLKKYGMSGREFDSVLRADEGFLAACPFFLSVTDIRKLCLRKQSLPRGLLFCRKRKICIAVFGKQ